MTTLVTLSTDELLALRLETVNDIEDIEKQLSRHGRSADGTYNQPRDQYYKWRNGAITALFSKLADLRNIKAELARRRNNDPSTFWYRHGKAAIELLQQVVEQEGEHYRSPKIYSLIDAYESELMELGLHYTTNTTTAVPN